MIKVIGRLVRGLFSQMVVVGLLLVLQVAFLVVLVLRLSEYFVYFYIALMVLSFAVTLHIVNRPGSPANKLAWVICILTVPLLGGLFYIYVYNQRHPRVLSRRLAELDARLAEQMPRDRSATDRLLAEGPHCRRMLEYMARHADGVVYDGAETEYYTIGEDMKAAMMAAMEGARRYIFLEFFIIKDGVFWREVRELLARKAAEGVDVRLMYDGMGCLMHLPMRYPRKLREMGLKVKVFSPFTPILSTIQNHRDHRKIVVVDGHTAFCGGINLADEYINVTHPYGHWKDTGLRVTGDAAWGFTLMFLSLWEILEPQQSDYAALRPETMPPIEPQGYVMPYGDSPMDDEKVGEYMYLRAIQQAQRYLHIMSPYLILEQSMVDAMVAAAKSGVEVKLIVPSVADHWYAMAVARAYYRELTTGGVQIYEYSPGFIHAKSFVWDDREAIVGTINLDYRSLYLHFECAAWMMNTPTVAHMEADFQATLAQSRLLTLEDCRVRNPFRRALYCFLRIFAPLM